MTFKTILMTKPDLNKAIEDNGIPQEYQIDSSSIIRFGSTFKNEFDPSTKIEEFKKGVLGLMYGTTVVHNDLVPKRMITLKY